MRALVRYCEQCKDPLPAEAPNRQRFCALCAHDRMRATQAERQRRWRQRHPERARLSRLTYIIHLLERLGYRVIPPNNR